MNKKLFIPGLLAGAICIVAIIIEQSFNPYKSLSQLIGFGIMVPTLAIFIFQGIKKYRDEVGGVINFKSALKVGLGISLLASVSYIFIWEVNLKITETDYASEYIESQIELMRQSNASQEELDNYIKEMEEFKKLYENIFFRIPITFTEIFPVGLLLSLISAGLFRNPNFLKSEELITQS